MLLIYFAAEGMNLLLTSCWYNMCAAILYPALSRVNAIYTTFLFVRLLTSSVSREIKSYFLNELVSHGVRNFSLMIFPLTTYVTVELLSTTLSTNEKMC